MHLTYNDVMYKNITQHLIMLNTARVASHFCFSSFFCNLTAMWNSIYRFLNIVYHETVNITNESAG